MPHSHPATERPIKVGKDPQYIAITPDGKTAYVANRGPNVGYGDTVTPIVTATGKAGTAIKVGEDPACIAITPNGKTAYVANLNSGTVTPILTATGKAGNAITVGYSPDYITITP